MSAGRIKRRVLAGSRLGIVTDSAFSVDSGEALGSIGGVGSDISRGANSGKSHVIQSTKGQSNRTRDRSKKCKIALILIEFCIYFICEFVSSVFWSRGGLN